MIWEEHKANSNRRQIRNMEKFLTEVQTADAVGKFLPSVSSDQSGREFQPCYLQQSSLRKAQHIQETLRYPFYLGGRALALRYTRTGQPLRSARCRHGMSHVDHMLNLLHARLQVYFSALGITAESGNVAADSRERNSGKKLWKGTGLLFNGTAKA
jgi:hypothetical protein